MRKYTLYQAAKYSKISRYKLELAIKEGLLKTIDGKGNIKCFIYEDELNQFLDEYGDQYIRHDFKDESKVYISPEINNFISKDIHEKMLQEKERIIQLLESQNDKFGAMANPQLQSQVQELQSIVKEAIELAPSSTKKTQLKERFESSRN